MEQAAWFGFGMISAPFLWVVLILGFESIFLGYCAQNEYPFSAISSVIIFFFLFYLMGVFNPIQFIWHNLPYAVIGIVGYGIIGVLYARYIKWTFYVRAWMHRAREKKMLWLASKNISGDTIPPELRSEWKNYIENDYRRIEIFTPLKVIENKARFATWVAYWPFSALFTLIKDPFKQFIDASYHYHMTAMQKQADKAAEEVMR